MGFQPAYIDEIEVRMSDVDKTRKSYFDRDSQAWEDIWIYRIGRRKESEQWLKTHYSEFENVAWTGWHATFDRLVMSERIYLHYCLANAK